MSNNSFTANGALSLASTTDARLNLFFKTVRNIVVDPLLTKEEQTENQDNDSWDDVQKSIENDNGSLSSLIEESWRADPLDTLKILFNWRDCRGGKGDRYGFIFAMSLLDQSHPKWLCENLEHIAFYGRHLDLIHLWYLVSDGTKQAIMDIITKQLNTDVTALVDSKQVSLLAKWIPTENGKYDRLVPGHPRFNITLCRNLLNETKVTTKEISKLRKDYISPLRKKIRLVETALCEKKYDMIDYSQVPSVAMKRYRNAFRKHDEERFNGYLGKVSAGEAKINSSQVMPHDIVRHYLGNGAYDEVLELQWKEIQKTVDECEAFKDSISIVDVSGSMSGTPMEVAIALGLLSSNESNDNQVMTFSADPTLHTVPSGTLKEKVDSLRYMDWGMNTDISKSFQLLLKMCRDSQKKIKKVFIFSDMQFDQGTSNNSTTHFNQLRQDFNKYEMEMPTIIFWNLQGLTSDFPVQSNDRGVVMLSGFSPSLLKAVMEGKNITPMMILLNIIHQERYDRIQAPSS